MEDDVENETSPGMQRQLSENTMEYMLFLIEQEPNARRYLAELEKLRKDALQREQLVSQNYIWQRDQFNLEQHNEDGLIYLRGDTDYGDAVEDEWFIVFMLREISISHPNAWIRVSDADGEFLLVEAANVLPSWLSPEMDRFRAWIHNGHLYIIPLSTESSPPASKNLSLKNAINFIQKNKDSLVQSPFIEAEAFYRLGKYPGHVEKSIHHALVRIPRKLAYIIHEIPKSLPAAIEAFYLRDAIDLKRVSSASGPLTFIPNDMVTVSVRFSKILFAQLRSQRFEAPVQWKEIIDKSTEDGISDKERARIEDGMKLTCGYEILSTKAAKQKSRSVRELALTLTDMEEEDEEVTLPTDEEIEAWPNVKEEDDESWMDINYEDFERELDGKASKHSNENSSGFGDARTQEDLKKIVSRFEAFLNDDTAGLDGAQLDEMDRDDDDDDDDEDDEFESDSEDQEVSFDEAEFARMMREMMGLPGGPEPAHGQPPKRAAPRNEAQEIQEISSQMEAELRKEGALKIDPVDNSHRALKGAKENPRSSTNDKDTTQGTKKSASDEDEDEDERSDEEVDIDYNLARNLLESFKSQGGMAGPTGNLLGLMGFQLPRDEDDGKDIQENK